MCVLQSDIITLKKAISNNIQGLFQVFFTVIINIKGKYSFFVHFWHQTFMALALVMSILTLAMLVNDTSNSFIFHINYFFFIIVNLAKKLVSNPYLPPFFEKLSSIFNFFRKNQGHVI